MTSSRTVTAALLALVCVLPACRGGSSDQSGRPFRTLDAAVKAGVVDEPLVGELQNGRSVDAFVILVADAPQLPAIPNVRPEYRERIMVDELKKQFATAKVQLR